MPEAKLLMSEQKLKMLARDAKGEARAGTPREAAQKADAMLLAVHWSRIKDVLNQTGDLSGKVIVTCSLPMNDDNAELVVAHTSSGAEELAKMILYGQHPHAGGKPWERCARSCAGNGSSRFLLRPLGRIGDEYVKALYRFAEANGIPVVHFKKGQNKEEVARPYLEAAAKEGKERVVIIGMAQEKASVWRSWPRKGQEKARHPHMDWRREMAFINHFYFYLWDLEWGAAFWKTNAYAPFPIWLWLNGHEWAKRQLDKAGIGYEALDNGFRGCRDEAGLQKICDRLGPAAVRSFFARWSRRLPSVFTEADRLAGYGYEMAFRQFEISDTLVFDRPQRQAGCGLKE